MTARCPGCGERVLIEFDPVLQHWHCAVCARTWHARLGDPLPQVNDDQRSYGRLRGPSGRSGDVSARTTGVLHLIVRNCKSGSSNLRSIVRATGAGFRQTGSKGATPITRTRRPRVTAQLKAEAAR